MSRPSGPVPDFLDRAFDRGLISAEQHASLLALASGSDPASREITRGFNWVTVAYALGALLVVFAGGWFLAQRWLYLGPAGVLLVVTAYGVAAGMAARWLERHDFPEAAGVAAMIAIALTPVAVWALQSLTTWWPVEVWGQPYYPEYPPAEASRWVVAELATILAGLLVLRRRPWSAVAFPVAVALCGLVLHVPRLFASATGPRFEQWTFMTGALLVCAIADATDRRVARQAGPGRGDLAFPLWVAGLVALGLAILSMWNTAGAWRHGLPLLALAAVAAALYLGRRTHLAFGAFAVLLYLVHLAGVFRATAYFPVVLAVMGGALLAATVWLQRRFPALAARLATARGARGGLPGSPLMPWLVAGLSLGITLLRLPEAAEERVNREFQQRLHILRMHSGSIRAAPSRPFPRPAVQDSARPTRPG